MTTDAITGKVMNATGFAAPTAIPATVETTPATFVTLLRLIRLVNEKALLYIIDKKKVHFGIGA